MARALRIGDPKLQPNFLVREGGTGFWVREKSKSQIPRPRTIAKGWMYIYKQQNKSRTMTSSHSKCSIELLIPIRKSFVCSFHVFLDVQYSGSLNLWKTEGANARLSFARAGKALAISGANNSVQVISGQSLLQWTDDSSVELQGWFSDFGRKSFYYIQNNKCS